MENISQGVSNNYLWWLFCPGHDFLILDWGGHIGAQYTENTIIIPSLS